MSKSYNKRIFLLTDGDVHNPGEVYDVIKKGMRDNGKDRVFTFGIGNGCDKTLVKEAALHGKGDYALVGYDDLDKLNEKVVDLL